MSDYGLEHQPGGSSGTGVPHTPPESLGALLREARRQRELDLSDIARVTHVRKEYLAALEEGRYDDLPEDVYARNFLRLYADTVGLDHQRTLDAYQRERNGVRAAAPATVPSVAPTPRSAPAVPAGGDPEAAASDQVAGRPANTPSGRQGAPRRGLPDLPNLAPALATVLLVVAIVALALWGFNNTFFRPSTRAPSAPPPQAPSQEASPPAAAAGGSGGLAASTTASGESAGGEAEGASDALAAPGDALTQPASGAAGPAAVAQAQDALLSVDTLPPGAEVTVDGFPLPGTTPIREVSVTALDNRMVRVTLPGYEPIAERYDLSFDRALSFNLTPVAAPESAAGTPPATDAAAAASPGAGQGTIAISITEPTWLEVYGSTSRNAGERLVYTTAQPGASYTFPLPVYVHVGNAAGVQVSIDGGEPAPMGSSGSVTGRAFD